MSAPRAAAALVVLLALALGAGSAGARTAADAPSGLRAFLLRADEPARTAFPRTPAFAWSPFPGAASYEFQLSTSSTFRENAVVWRCPSATCPQLDSPVAAPSMSLPWITGSPHSLYARVRAVLGDGTKTGWSDDLGLDVVPPAPPTPLPSRPGLLRWTPVPGASGYQVWLLDAPTPGGSSRIVTSFTNVLDEREIYTFHQASSWIANVRWRVRALRNDLSKNERLNAIPATLYGAWSPIYRSTNAAPTDGPIKLGSTVSDVIANGGAKDDAHRLTPGFTWTGNESLDGDRAELFRVYVFTDKQCINRVFTSPVVGSPAYAARPGAGIALPTSGSAIASARASYLPMLPPHTQDGTGATFDDEPVPSTESAPAATPTTTLPLVGGNGASPAFVTPAEGTDVGAPVSLWDNGWPQGGYYWTVIPVEPVAAGAAGTTLAASAPAGSTTVVIASSPGFAKGDLVQVGSGTTTEVLTVSAVNGNAVTFTGPTLSSHKAGDPIAKLGGAVVYKDLELAQDACAAGRVARLGISSEPSVVAGGDLFASGLSPTGRLTSAVRSASFYKSPLVSWTPALGATLYQLQWSKKAAPFTPEPGPGGAAGILTGATSYVLPLQPGTWYYRVRGIDWSLPTGAQQMGWSDVATIVVTKPTFKVIQSAAPAVKRKPKAK